MKLEDFIFTPDIEITVAKQNHQTSTATGLDEFATAAVYISATSTAIYPSTTSNDNDTSNYCFYNTQILDGYAFAVGPTKEKAKQTANLIIPKIFPREITSATIEPNILVCRTFKTKNRYTIAGRATTDDIKLLAYNPKTRKLSSIFSSNIAGTQTSSFKTEIEEGSYIFAISSPGLNITNEITNAFSSLPKTAPLSEYINKLSKFMNPDFVTGIKLPAEREYDDFVLKLFRAAIIDQNLKCIENFATQFGLQVTLDMLDKLSSSNILNSNPLNKDYEQFTRDTLQQYFENCLRININDNNDLPKLRKFVRTSNLNIKNTEELLIKAAKNPTLSKDQLKTAQSFFYQMIYEKQKETRFLRSVGATAASIIFAPTIIVPIISLWLWRRAKRHEDIQMREEMPVSNKARESEGTVSRIIKCLSFKVQRTAQGEELLYEHLGVQNQEREMTEVIQSQSTDLKKNKTFLHTSKNSNNNSENDLENDLNPLTTSAMHLRKVKITTDNGKDTFFMRRGEQTKNYDMKHESNQSCFGFKK